MMPALTRAAALLALALLVSGPAAAQYGGGGDAGSRAAAIEALLTDPEAQRLLDADAALKRRLQQAYAKLNMASDGYTSSAVAQQQAIAAAREFQQIETILRTRLDQVRAAAEAARLEQEEADRTAMRDEADAVAAEAKRLLALPAPHDAPTLERRGELGRALQAFQRLGRDASLAKYREARDRLASAGADVEATLHDAGTDTGVRRPGGGSASEARPRPAPDRLRDAVAAFLAGTYARAADILADPELGDAQATRAAYMVRGAALFAMYVETGERDASLLARVRADVQACRQLDANAVPSRALFSPRYAELYSLP
jgi:hypothetical protein